MQPTRYDEIFRLIEAGKIDPAAVVSETVSLEDISERLQAMTDFKTVGIPVINEFQLVLFVGSPSSRMLVRG